MMDLRKLTISFFIHLLWLPPVQTVKGTQWTHTSCPSMGPLRRHPSTTSHPTPPHPTFLHHIRVNINLVKRWSSANHHLYSQLDSRSANISPAQKSMFEQKPSQSSLLSYNQFSHQSHLQPFGNPIQSASGANHYTQSKLESFQFLKFLDNLYFLTDQYNAYTGTSSPSLSSSSAANNFDYSHSYHNSSSSHLPSSSSYSQYISNCSASGYPSYPQVPTAHIQGHSNSIPSASNSSYQSLNTGKLTDLCKFKEHSNSTTKMHSLIDTDRVVFEPLKHHQDGARRW